MIRIAGAHHFFSYLDEKAFFEWAESIPCVVETTHGDLHIASDDLEESDLRDLLAIMTRYQLQMKELQQFLNPENEEWFRSADAYWYESVFGEELE